MSVCLCLCLCVCVSKMMAAWVTLALHSRAYGKTFGQSDSSRGNKNNSNDEVDDNNYAPFGPQLIRDWFYLIIKLCPH